MVRAAFPPHQSSLVVHFFAAVAMNPSLVCSFKVLQNAILYVAGAVFGAIAFQFYETVAGLQRPSPTVPYVSATLLYNTSAGGHTSQNAVEQTHPKDHFKLPLQCPAT